MIKPEELRIGNWFTKDGEYHNVGHIQKNFYNTCVNNYGPENINPIPLTPEILEACGFKEEFVHGDKRLMLDTFEGFIFCSFEKGVNLYDTATKWIGKTKYYLHELQNLYFYLTGKELEVKLPQLV